MAHQEQKWQELADYRPPWGSVVYVNFSDVRKKLFPLHAGELFPFRGAENLSKGARPCIVLCNFDHQRIDGNCSTFVVLLPLTSQDQPENIMKVTPREFDCKGDDARKKLSDKPSYIKAFTPAVFRFDRLHGLATLPEPSTEFREGKLSSAGWAALRRHINKWEHSDIAQYIKTPLSSQNGDDARSHTSGYPRVQQQTPLARASSADSGQQSLLLLAPEQVVADEGFARVESRPPKLWTSVVRGSTERDADVPEHHTSPPSSSSQQNITICPVLRKRARILRLP